MIQWWSFYNLETGLFTGRRFAGPTADPPAVPEGLGVVAGEHDHMRRRVNLDTGEVEPYQPPAPDDDHEWNAQAERWQKKPAALAAEAEDRAARDFIAAAEAGQLRAMRELLLNPNDQAARTRLQTIDATIAAQRSKVIPR